MRVGEGVGGLSSLSPPLSLSLSLFHSLSLEASETRQLSVNVDSSRGSAFKAKHTIMHVWLCELVCVSVRDRVRVCVRMHVRACTNVSVCVSIHVHIHA